MAETLVNKTQAGEGIWHQDNLVAGSGISITQVPQPVIDANTLGVWHFENNLDNTVSGSSYTVSSSTIVASNSQYKFGNYSLCSSSGSTGNITLIDQALPSGDFTVDFWLRTGNSSPSLTIGLNTSSDLNYGPTRQGLYINQNSTFIGFNTMSSGGTQGSTSYGTTIETANWHHVAIVRKDNVANFYLDGVLQASKAASSTYYLQANFNYQAQGTNYVPQFIDELRLSNIVRWTSDFTPYTAPYSASAGPAQYAINNTKADPDLSSYLQNTTTQTDSLTIDGTAATGPYAVNIGKTSVARDGGTAIGYGATTSTYMYSTAVGYGAKALNSNAIALSAGQSVPATASGSSSIAIGSYSAASAESSLAVGLMASTSGKEAIALGSSNSSATAAKATANKAIQLGSGTNNTANTFKVFNTTVVDANGKVPTASLEADLTTKADTDLSNVTKPYVTETYVNGTSWYRVWSDGWCEQGGSIAAATNGTVYLLKPFVDTTYKVFMSTTSQNTDFTNNPAVDTKTISSFTWGAFQGSNSNDWMACGYIS